MEFSISAIYPFFEAKERAKFWREKGYIFDSSHMTVHEMDNMVRAYEKAHNISAQK